ncbi:hypothetical protein BDD12DRAFT_563153 [Trichophaea hybrida]|nr:hypothetical protein BDD12DRAFT_563153 [Trichophaea hybrida]
MPLILTNSQMKEHILKWLLPQYISTLNTSLTTALTTFSLSPSSIQQPLRTSLTVGNATTLFMPCSYDNTTSIKTVCVSPDHPPNGNITLLSATTGELEAILHAEEITGFRTALVSMLLLRARHAAGMRVRNAVVFGTGKQAVWAAKLFELGFEGVKVMIVGRGTGKEVRDKMPGELKGRSWYHFGRKDGKEEELRDWVENADAVFCCTPAKEPLFPMQWITENTYVSLVGSYTPDMVEVEPGLLKKEGVTMVVDSVEACLKEAGELIQGGLERDDVVELGTVLAKGEAVTGICVFKCVGMGLMDLVVGREIVRIAEEAGIGVKVEGFDGEEAEE